MSTTLTAHLAKQKQLLQSVTSGNPPQRHVDNGTVEAYKSYLEREVTRTQKKLDNLSPAKVK